MAQVYGLLVLLSASRVLAVPSPSLLRRDGSTAVSESAADHEEKALRDLWRWGHDSRLESAPRATHVAPAGVASSLGELQAVEKQMEGTRLSSPDGLPWVKGERAKWLVRDDGLITDARTEQEKTNGGGMLLVHLVSQDASSFWETQKPQRPDWLRAILAANRHHVQEYGHALAGRWKSFQPQVTDWQAKKCIAQKVDEAKCQRDNERENLNWEKHLMLLDYLESPQNFSHVLMMDADAAFVRPDLDTMRRLAALLEEKEKDLFLSDEDWLKHGEGRINGGVVFAKNTNFTRALFKDLWECHRNLRIEKPRTLHDGGMGCGGNEMDALNEWHGRKGMKEKMHVAGGKRWNRGGEVLFRKSEQDADDKMNELGMKDPNLEIMHFMGSAKMGAPDVICRMKYGMTWNLTMEGPDGYGCSPVV